jgi:hypothetical protein
MSDTLLGILITELGKVLEPLGAVVEDPQSLRRLLAEIGASAESAGGDRLVAALTAVMDLKDQLDLLAAHPTQSFEAIAAILDLSDRAWREVRALGDSGSPASALENFGRDFVDLLIAAYLANWHPLARQAAALLTLLEPAEAQHPGPLVLSGTEVLRMPFVLDRIRLDRLPILLRDPAGTLREAYVNDLHTVADANAMADKLFPRIRGVLRELDVPCRYGFRPGDEPLLGDAAPLVDHALIVYTADMLADASAEAGIVLMLSSADRGDLGLVACPFGVLTLNKKIGKWTIDLDFTAEVETVAYGRHGVTLLASLSTAEASARFRATLATPTDGPAFVFGSPIGTRLEVGGAQLTAETALSEARQTVALSASASSAAIVISGSDGDGFVGSIVPADGLRATFDLGLAWSNERGLTFHGSTGLDATLPVGISLGPVIVPAIHLGLLARDSSVLAEVSASVATSIGPIRAVVDRIGITMATTFPKDGGNLGAAHLSLGFKPPNGVGLAIDAAAITGAGYLFYDSVNEQYAGALQLQIGNLELHAIGLLTTRMPDGSRGFSLIITITAQGFQPIQLGFGFRLSGIGGLIGVNRTVAVEVLRSGLRENSLDAVLFPEDPVRNAAEIVSNIRRIFPPAQGRVVFGPMVVIDWGTPPVLTMELAVILELPSPVRLIVLGQLRAALPQQDLPLVRLKMDVLGVLEIDRGELAIDAALYDSQVLGFAITGDMALRARWVSNPMFIMSAGGLNPRFKPPAEFPRLNRLAISLTTGDNPRVRLEAYLALTSNTAQVGARLDLRVSAAGFSIEGYLYFDALFEFSPFQFIADMGAGVTLKWHGHTLMGVQLEMTLSGPTQWRAKGKATFKIWIFSKSVGFDKTFGPQKAPPVLPPGDPLPELLAALRDRRSWGAAVADRTNALVSLREAAASDSDLSVHPIGILGVRQRVVPLDIEISKFGNTAPAGDRRFRITQVRLGNQVMTGTKPLTDYFAPGQFLQLTEAQSLSRPSFEQLQSGVEIAGIAVSFGGQANSALMAICDALYETVTYSPGGQFDKPPTTAPMTKTALLGASEISAAWRATARPGGAGRYSGVKRDVTPRAQAYVVARTDDLTPATEVVEIDPTKGTSYTAAAQALAKHVAANKSLRGRMKVVARQELTGVGS